MSTNPIAEAYDLECGVGSDEWDENTYVRLDPQKFNSCEGESGCPGSWAKREAKLFWC